MRFKKDDGDIRLYAVAGTRTVLLVFDIAKEKLKGKDFIGFSIERYDESGNKLLLNGSKHFKSLTEDRTLIDQDLKYLSFVQSYLWKDYLAEPGKEYNYFVSAIEGPARKWKPFLSNKIKVRTEILLEGTHSVFFNYGVTGSQGYAKHRLFGNKPIRNLPPDIKEMALDYLGRELYKRGLLEFLRKAASPDYSLYCAFYEIQYPGFLRELKKVEAKCNNLEIVYSAQPGQNKINKGKDKDPGNKESLNKFKFKNTHPRTVVNQPHNKFMVLCKGEEPVEVWTGSANITLSGLFGQSNTGHWIKDPLIAQKYKKYWDLLKGNPSKPALSKLSIEIQPDLDLRNLGPGTYIFFSPRGLPVEKGQTPQILKNYAEMIDYADELVCMIFPFNYDDVFKKVYDEDKTYLRFLIFEKESEAKRAKSSIKNDVDLKVTAGAILDSEVEQFAYEVDSKDTVNGGIRFVHNKFMIIDPLGSKCAILSGSANFSKSSITSNDENSVLIIGDNRVADIYLTEFNRLFEHFWPRYIRKLHQEKNLEEKEGFDKPLDETNSWHNDYYNQKSYHFKRNKIFKDMLNALPG